MAEEHDYLEVRFRDVNEALSDPLITDEQRDELLGQLDEIEYDACIQAQEQERQRRGEEA